MNHKIKNILRICAFLICLGGIHTGLSEVQAEAPVKIIREQSGDLESWKAVELPEEVAEEWEKSQSIQYAAGDAGEEAFLERGSDYGYQDMAKRSNGEIRQYLYEQMTQVCKAFTINGQDAAVEHEWGEEFYVVGNVRTGTSMTEDELAEIYFTFRNDNPQFFWLSNTVLFSYGGSYCGITILTYEAYQNGAVRRAAFEEIMETSKIVYESQITQEDSKYHKVLKLHDTLIADIEYSENIYEETAHSIAGAMTSARSAVCEGYAKVMQLMMNHYGIQNIYIVGDAGGGHAWNMVYMNDGKYYWLDATWDDQPYETFQHSYFLVGNQNFTDHTPDLSTNTGSGFLYDLPVASEENYVYDPNVPVVLKGDINEDGNITIIDLMMCLHHVSGKTVLSGNAYLAADVNEDGVITIVDLMRLLHVVSGKTSSL